MLVLPRPLLSKQAPLLLGQPSKVVATVGLAPTDA
jgi:hypothetical protein